MYSKGRRIGMAGLCFENIEIFQTSFFQNLSPLYFSTCFVQNKFPTKVKNEGINVINVIELM